SGDSKGVGLPRCIPEACLSHASNHLLRLRKTLHGCRKVRVGSFDSRNERAHTWQHMVKVQAVNLPLYALGLREIQNPAFTIRFQNTEDFPQAQIVVRQITKPES